MFLSSLLFKGGGFLSSERPVSDPSERIWKIYMQIQKDQNQFSPNKGLAILVFGNGDAGELGLGPDVEEATAPRLNPFLRRTVQLDCGSRHTIALTRDNGIVTWGVNDNGALGRDTAWRSGWRTVDENPDLNNGLNPLESVPTEISDLSFPPGTKFVQVVAGDNCSFALTDTGLVYGWGTFKDSQGNERFGHDANGNLIQRQSTPTLIPNLHNITQLACGANHSLALSSTGQVWSWGSSEQGQLGRGRRLGRHVTASTFLAPAPLNLHNIRYIASGAYHSFAVDKHEYIWGWGLNSFGQVGTGSRGNSNESSSIIPYPLRIRDLAGATVTYMAGGAHHSAAVTGDGQCLVWGRADGGRLGIEFTPEQLADRGLVRCDEGGKPRVCLRPTVVSGLRRVRHVACGTDHTVFVTDEEGKAYATGINREGQLGLGHKKDVEAAQRVKSRDLDGWRLAWAGAGERFSVVGARTD